jgi:hypothetical protein
LGSLLPVARFEKRRVALMKSVFISGSLSEQGDAGFLRPVDRRFGADFGQLQAAQDVSASPPRQPIPALNLNSSLFMGVPR